MVEEVEKANNEQLLFRNHNIGMNIGPINSDSPRTCVTLYWTVMNMMANFAVTCNAKKEIALTD